MADVYVPVLKREVRVRRTSVERTSAEAEETTVEDPPSGRQQSVAQAVAWDELLRKSWADVCVRLTTTNWRYDASKAPLRTGAVRANGAAMSRSAASRSKETVPLN
jgi:hypothetical protein